MGADHLLTDPCALVSVTEVQDDDGAPIQSDAASVQTKCYMEVSGGDERDGAIERGIARFWLPASATPAGSSHLVHSTGRWEIDGAPEPARNPRTGLLSHWVVQARQAA